MQPPDDADDGTGMMPHHQYRHEALEVKAIGPGAHGLFATRRLPPGTRLFSLEALPRVTMRTRYSLQLDADVHLDRHPQGGIDDFLNHGCWPNARVNLGTLEILTCREIERGEQLRINYCATEEELLEPFDCDCGSPGCYGRVAGFRSLDSARRRELSSLVSPWLRRKYGV